MKAPGKQILFKNASDWRAWLRRNHCRSKGIWLIYYKKSAHLRSITYQEALDEALCFGWIDSRVQRIDDERYRQLYTPRREDSIWSERNKARVRVLIRERKMTAAGLCKIQAAKQNGQWNVLAPLRKPLRPPRDLAQALAADQKASRNFKGFPPSARKMYIYWVVSAKQPETRARRIKLVVNRSARNQRPGTL